MIFEIHAIILELGVECYIKLLGLLRQDNIYTYSMSYRYYIFFFSFILVSHFQKERKVATNVFDASYYTHNNDY